ncbi:MAG: tyrosine-protein phosphatase [Clostridiales bacterium]|nr:tyrosine-protein phosphatase [Clostridiales bacterium]
MLKNQIDLPGVLNSRQIGSFPAGNRRVKDDLLIRTAALNGADGDAVRTLSERYRVQKVIDFRMKGESMVCPDPVIPGAEHISIPVVEVEDYVGRLGNPELAKKYLSQSLGRDEMIDIAYEYGLIGPEMYTAFMLADRGIRAYRGFFDILLGSDPADGAILWHCSDGKDRAGMASVLLLTALGASIDTVYEDFFLTNEYNAKAIEMVRDKYSSTGIPEDKLDVLIFSAGGVIEKYLTNVLHKIDARYGGITGYLKDALGLREQDFDTLREKYTE